MVGSYENSTDEKRQISRVMVAARRQRLDKGGEVSGHYKAGERTAERKGKEKD